jgi:hypothetical protein
MDQSPSWKVDLPSVSQEIPSILWQPNVYHGADKWPPFFPILTEINPVHTLVSYFFKIHVNIISPSTPRYFSVLFSSGGPEVA